MLICSPTIDQISAYEIFVSRLLSNRGKEDLDEILSVRVLIGLLTAFGAQPKKTPIFVHFIVINKLDFLLTRLFDGVVQEIGLDGLVLVEGVFFEFGLPRFGFGNFLDFLDFFMFRFIFILETETITRIKSDGVIGVRVLIIGQFGGNRL